MNPLILSSSWYLVLIKVIVVQQPFCMYAAATVLAMAITARRHPTRVQRSLPQIVPRWKKRALDVQERSVC